MPDDHTAAARPHGSVRDWSRRRRRVVLGAALVVVAAAGAGVNLATGSAPGSTTVTSTTAPVVEGPTATGGHFALASDRGHWVLVNFFASWCADCRQELTQLTTLQRTHPHGLRVVSVDGADDSLSTAEHLIRSARGSWPLVDDPVATVDYRVVGLPESFLLDPDGDIVGRIIGGLTDADVDRQLDTATR